MKRSASGMYFWSDGRDVASSGIDISEVQTFADIGQRRWTLLLHEPPSPASTLDPRLVIVEYGVVVDADGDRVADCQIGINTDAPKSGDYRVFVRNLRTGVIDERVGPPYGYPIDFALPDGQPEGHRQADLFFLHEPLPCDPFNLKANFYTWASITEKGRVTHWDFAPNAAWLARP